MGARRRNSPRRRAVSSPRHRPEDGSLETGEDPRRRGAEELEARGQTIREMDVDAAGKDPELFPFSDMAKARYAQAIAATSRLKRKYAIGQRRGRIERARARYNSPFQYRYYRRLG